ncbi:MAG TPA: histidine phosphatase family protein [Pseudonocardia sp.]
MPRLLVGVMLALSVFVTACAANSPSTPTPSSGASGAAASPTAATGTVVMLIRHGEKPDGSDPGVDAQGNEDANSLTATGWQRANALADLFDPASGQIRAGLVRPTAIYAAGANDDGEGTRPRETVAPLAQRLGITQNNDYGKGDEKKLIGHVIAQPGATLISWQHGELPALAAAFPGASPKPPKDWPSDRFDVIWTFTKTADGWQFAQVPELLLPQDTAAAIDE